MYYQVWGLSDAWGDSATWVSAAKPGGERDEPCSMRWNFFIEGFVLTDN